MVYLSKKSLFIYVVSITGFLLMGCYYLTPQNDVTTDGQKNPGIHVDVKNYRKGILASKPKPTLRRVISGNHSKATIAAGPVSSMCDYIKRDRNRNRTTIVLTTTNSAFLDITENMLESAKRTRACHNITVIAEDEQSYKALSERAKTQPGLSVRRTNTSETVSKDLKLNSAPYNNFVNKRPDYILTFLEMGYKVLFVDADSFWLRDPFVDLRGNDFDIAMHNELKIPKVGFCAGFVLYRPTEAALRLVRSWVLSLAMNRGKTSDQRVLNHLIAHKDIPGLKVRTLDPLKYPDGKRFMKDAWRKKHMESVNVLHLSFIIGHEQKVKALKKFGLWII